MKPHRLAAAASVAVVVFGCSRSELPTPADQPTAAVDASVADAAPLETRALRRIARELAAMGLDIDVSRIKSKRVGLAEATRFLDHQQDQLFAPHHFTVFHTVGTALGIPSGMDGADLRRQTVTMLTKAFAGLYDWGSDTMMLLDTDMAKLLRQDAVLSHELVHAFQDQHWDLTRLGKTKSVEQLKVLQCLIEGHAELVSTAMMLKREGKSLHALDPKMFRNALGRLSVPEAAQAHYQLGLALLLRAYRAGKLRLNRPTWPHIPPSTEQIIHPEKYGADQPVRVTLPEWPARAPFATKLAEDTYGELLLYILLLQVSHDPSTAYVAATGWDGDRLSVYKTARGNALMWRLVFDRPVDAMQLTRVLGKLPLATVKRHGRTVDLAYAKDEKLQAIVAKAFDTKPMDIPADPADAISTAAAELSWAGTDSERPTLRGNRWVHREHGLSIPVLPDWLLINHQGRVVLGKQLDGVTTHAISVMAISDPFSTTIDQLTTETKRVMAKLPGLKLVHMERRKISGVDTLVTRVVGRPPQALVDMVTTSVSYRRGGRWVQVVISVDKRYWENSKADVKRIVDGLTLEK